MALDHLTFAHAAPRSVAYKLSDGDGLYLLVKPNGAKLWRYRYQIAKRESTISLGAFPETSLSDARRKRDAARDAIEQGNDPAMQRRLEKLAQTANTFEAVANEYLANLEAAGSAETTMTKNRWMLLQLAEPLLHRPIAHITPPEVLMVLKRVEKSGRHETARKLRGVIGSVFRLAIATLRAPTDPTLVLRGALVRPVVTHRAAITNEKQFGGLMRAIDDFDGWPTIRAALLVLALTMTRPGDVRGMRRSELDLERALWRVPAERTKMRRPHDVPLSRQAIAVFADILPLAAEGDDALVFPSIRSTDKPLSENAFNAALRRMGFLKDEMTAHGFRAAASTILNERGINPDVIEAALAHQHHNVIRRTYNRATYWPERIKLLQDWADMLDEFRGLAVAADNSQASTPGRAA